MGYLRMRRSVKLAPGVRLTFSGSGLGVSFGGTGLRYSIGPTGRRTTSVGIPGSGISYVSTGSGDDGSPAPRPSSSPPLPGPAPVDPVTVIPTLGLFASKVERDYRAGILAHLTGDAEATIAAFERVLAADATLGGAHLFTGVAYDTRNQPERGIPHLEAIVTGAAQFPDPLLNKFLPADRFDTSLTVRVAEEVSVHPPIGDAAAVLVLAELLQGSNKLDEAIGVIQQLHTAAPDDSIAVLSLADLLYADRDYEGVIELTNSLANADDVTLATLDLRAKALCESGHPDAGFEVFRDALAARAERDPALLRLVRYDRAVAYEAAGRKGRARLELEKLYGADSTYRDVASRLEAMKVATGN